MDLVNTTPFSAAFVNTIMAEDRLLGAVVAKAVFRVESGALVPDPERQWPVGGQPVPTEFGELEGDAPFLKEGLDLVVLGKAYAPARQAVPTTTVAVSAGEFRYEMLVIGDRTWVEQNGALVPSAPELFESMPLTWDHAFGGKAIVPPSLDTSPIELEMPFAANPEGRGYCVDEQMVAGTPLPNLEDPAHPISAWNDWPEPAGVGPYKREWSLRAMRSIEYDTACSPPRIKRIKPAYYNNANPRLVLAPGPQAGEEIRVSGVRPDGEELAFPLPDLSLHVYVQLAERAYVFPAHLDTLLVLAEEARVMLGYRCVFNYRMVPLERRAAVLRIGPAPAAPPAMYKIDWTVLDAPEAPARG